MATSLKPLHEQIMVITGASSGIGLATARMAAKKGAKLVLAARNKEDLDEVVQEINDNGGEAVAVVADVGKRTDVEWIADTAIEKFNRIDTWVNISGIGIYGRLTEIDEEDFRRLFNTNFYGIVNGSLIAAKHLREKGGAIINMGSTNSDVAFPLLGAYTASKHAVKGFTDALRVELREEGAPISVTLIKPGSINTPFPKHAKKITEHEPTIPPPVYEPDEVAYAVLHAAEHPKRDIYVGSSAKAMSSLNKIAPDFMDWVSKKLMFDLQQKDNPAYNRAGSLHGPGLDGKEYGDKEAVRKKSLYTRASLHPFITGAALAAGAAAVYLIKNR